MCPAPGLGITALSLALLSAFPSYPVSKFISFCVKQKPLKCSLHSQSLSCIIVTFFFFFSSFLLLLNFIFPKHITGYVSLLLVSGNST